MIHIEMMMRRKGKRMRRKMTRKMRRNVAFKATSSSKGKAKQETINEDEGSSFDEIDDEKMALFVK
jgi:hypothetical protein